MKIKTLAIVVLSALSLSSTVVSAATVVNGGTVHFRGEVVNAACAVNADSVDQTVQLGQVRTATLAAAGATSGAVSFNIRLDDCDATVSQHASVAFAGPSTAAEPTVLSLSGSASGSATDVGIQILDSLGVPLALDGGTFSTPTTLTDGSNVIPFQARYYALGAATAGIANADATFKVQYD